MHTTTITAVLARPGERKPLRARNASIAALGIVSAAMVAGMPVPSHTPAALAASTPASPAHLHEHNAMSKSGGK